MSKHVIRSQRRSSFQTQVLAAGLCVGGLLSAATCLGAGPNQPNAVPETPATQPATQPAAPIDPAVRALIIKLGDDDPAVRDDATKKLSDLGKAAVPALREAAQGDDPEARSRAKNLLQHIERHLPPPAPRPNGMGRSQSMRMSMNQGVRTIDVNDNGRKVHIVSKADGQIEMSVTGIEDGKEATETYHAKDADELKKDNPEAFAIYDQWAGANGAMAVRGHGQFGGQIHVQIMPGGPGGLPFPGGPGGAGGGGVLIPGGPVPGGPPAGGGVGVQPANPHDLQLRLEEQQKQIEELKRQLEAEIEQRTHDRMRGTGKDDAPSDTGKAEKSDKVPDKPADKADKPADRSDKAQDKPQTRPE
jgi:hypothetical protein